MIGIDVDIKDWLACVPSVERARPGRCPRCHRASRLAGGGLELHGHGLRERQVRGPLELGGAPQLVSLWLRRFRCVACRATITVGPAVLRAHRLFSAAAIALALALWSAGGLSACAVRAAVSPLKLVGASSARTWLTLRRWAADAQRLFSVVRPWPEGWPPRRVAERVSGAVASLAPGPGGIALRAFLGAARAT